MFDSLLDVTNESQLHAQLWVSSRQHLLRGDKRKQIGFRTNMFWYCYCEHFDLLFDRTCWYRFFNHLFILFCEIKTLSRFALSKNPWPHLSALRIHDTCSLPC